MILNVATDGSLREVAKYACDITDVNHHVHGHLELNPSIRAIWPGDTDIRSPPPDRIAELGHGVQALYIAAVLFFIALAYIISSEFKRRHILWIDHSVVMVLTGLVAGLLLKLNPQSQIVETAIFNEQIFTFVLLPIIIFESGLGLPSKHLFFKNLGTICVFAVAGTFFSTVRNGSTPAICLAKPINLPSRNIILTAFNAVLCTP